jgi:hypothetical protein
MSSLLDRSQICCRSVQGPKITLQVLAYPVVDYYAQDTNSYKAFANWYPGAVTVDTLKAAWDLYLGNATYSLSSYKTVTTGTHFNVLTAINTTCTSRSAFQPAQNSSPRSALTEEEGHSDA